MPTLISSRREVRQAALECIAVLFRTLGPSRVQKLLVEIDLLDRRVRARGMKAAVLARLARSQSPVIMQSSGKLVYVTRVPSGGSEWSYSSSGQSGADIHWIMFGPGMKTSESNPLSVVRPGSKCCCVSSTYAPPEICLDESSKRIIGRTHSRVNERLAAVESDGCEPSFEDDPLLARQKVQARAVSIYSGTIRGSQMPLPDLGFMTFNSSPPSDPVEKDPTVSDIQGEAERSPNNASDGEVSKRTYQFPERQNQTARTPLSSAGSKQVMSGSHANGRIGLKRKDLILPYMVKMPRELSKDVSTSLANSIMGCNSSKSTSQIEQVTGHEDSQSTTSHVHSQQLPLEVQHNPPKTLRKGASSQMNVNPEYPSPTGIGAAACEDSENEDSKTESVKTFPGRQKAKLKENISKSDLFYKEEEEEEDEDSGPFPNPTVAINEALGFLSQSDWQKICSGLRMIRRLACHHPEDVCPSLLKVSEKVTQQVKNLRSKVCISAIVCLRDLFKCLKKNMDTDLDRVVPTLLLKSAETNHFIRETAEQSLVVMLENTTPLRAVNSLINAGASHRNITIRIVTAQMMERLVELIGQETVFGGNEDLSGRILAVAVRFLNDGSADVRYSAQKILYALMFHANFNKFMKKIDDRQIQQKIDVLRRKGPTENGFRSSKSRIVATSGRHLMT